MPCFFRSNFQSSTPHLLFVALLSALVDTKPALNHIVAVTLAHYTWSTHTSPLPLLVSDRKRGKGPSESRQLTPTEAWSLYHFETHARDCVECYDPYTVYLERRQLCPNGHALSQDVALHVYYQAGEIYGKEQDDHKPVRVEVSSSYGQVRLLLKAMDRALKSTSRTAPVISYDRTYPVSPRRSSSTERRRDYDNEPREVIIEPHNSERERRSRHRSKAKPSGYKTVVIEDDVQPGPSSRPEPESEPEARSEPRPEARRRSTYERDLQRQQKDKGYRVEIREPARERRRKDERRSSTFWP